MKIGKLVLYSNSGKEWTQELCIGTTCELINVNDDLLGINEIKVLSSNSNKNLDPFDVIVPVFHKSEPLAYLLLGDFDGEKIEVSPIIKHLTFIQTLTNIIIVAVENKRLYKENLKQIAIKKEMELASEMQTMLFPKNLPNNSEIEVSAQYSPHQLVGGDYYDFIELNRDEIAFCIADVSGKGVPAALLMSNFQASLRALIKRTSSLSELVIELNKNILANANREKFITAFIGKYNLQTRNLQYINAGHNPPLLLVGHQFKSLSDGCTILGMFENLPSVTEKNITIAKDSLLTCFTDGVVEQPNSKNEEFELDNLEKSILLNKEKSTQQIINAIISKLDDFKKEIEYKDDIALLCLRLK
ncbi:MAG: PP2C family protein-serine/threonine phosphatase [Flavobacteriales bacterium]|nr:PP2C family protein-serine/threonine phosphatase [Flavobacteriales bacterium]